MTTAHDILRLKGHTVHSVRPNDTVLAALGVMAEHDIGAVIVLEADTLAGILTERDYARKVALVGRASKDSPVSAIMTPDVVCVPPSSTVEDCKIDSFPIQVNGLETFYTHEPSRSRACSASLILQDSTHRFADEM